METNAIGTLLHLYAVYVVSNSHISRFLLKGGVRNILKRCCNLNICYGMTPSVSKTCCSDMKFNSSCFMVRRVVFLSDKIWLAIKKKL